jgi:hypothetical protein
MNQNLVKVITMNSKIKRSPSYYLTIGILKYSNWGSQSHPQKYFNSQYFKTQLIYILKMGVAKSIF